MDRRMQFIGEWLEGLSATTDLAERYGISRKTAYKWIGRYREAGAEGLRERNSAPLNHGRSTPDEQVALILALKDRNRSWGPLKLVSKLKELRPDLSWPAPSTAGEILKRAGLVERRRRRHRVPPTLGGLTVAEQPNHVWGVDHKGWIRLSDGQRCEPLTVTDSFSRFLVAIEACSSTRSAEARPVFERAFAEYGLPQIIRSDNGTPFATTGVTGLSALAVWWTKLGIHQERIVPGKPQQNGRHERFHLTLKEAMDPPSADRAVQAVRFEAFRQDYNHERPHQALNQTPPARHYAPSLRPLPKCLPEPDYPREADIRKVRPSGEIRWGGDSIFVSETLIGEWVAIEEQETGALQMRFYARPIGIIDTVQKRLKRLGVPARGHAQTKESVN
ncbi:integrase core domain-containing protein [Sphingosinicella sp. BN140058]|uniref:integrase core domain-containing protein n=1 Tax=Sphingosinicella sp. BN140058 TaxID=1892855 RepID=UPI001010A136|nr:integrase core domain-containing protein [Sphingosinicella sp. BN140058]QAY76366.1 IS481 family transposase [Sphingosinicella sp. BN140058]